MEKGRMYISPYNSKLVIHAQGTLGLEILDQCPDVEYIFVTVGGGGIASGVLTAAKLINPKIKGKKNGNSQTRILKETFQLSAVNQRIRL